MIEHLKRMGIGLAYLSRNRVCGVSELDHWNLGENMIYNCPTCGSNNLSDMWQRGRKLRQECRDCGWIGEVRVPEQKGIVPLRKISAGGDCCGGHTFEVFDCYGHTIMSSRSYSTADEARAAIMQELEHGRTNEIAGPYTGILWPATVVVEGEIIQ